MAELTVGAPAPEFQVPALTRQGETEITLSDFWGKSSVVLYCKVSNGKVSNGVCEWYVKEAM